MRAFVSLADRCVVRTRHAARAFRVDRSGNVALIFALALIPVFGAVGVAVDYSRANAARTAMQAALDAAALMVSKEALNVTVAQVQKKGQRYFNAEFKRPEVNGTTATFTMQNN